MKLDEYKLVYVNKNWSKWILPQNWERTDKRAKFVYVNKNWTKWSKIQRCLWLGSERQIMTRGATRGATVLGARWVLSLVISALSPPCVLQCDWFYWDFVVKCFYLSIFLNGGEREEQGRKMLVTRARGIWHMEGRMSHIPTMEYESILHCKY